PRGPDQLRSGRGNEGGTRETVLEGTPRPGHGPGPSPAGRQVPVGRPEGPPGGRSGLRASRSGGAGRHSLVLGRLRTGHAHRRPLPNGRRRARRGPSAVVHRLPPQTREVNDLERYRDEFPVVGRKAYLIS